MSPKTLKNTLRQEGAYKKAQKIIQITKQFEKANKHRHTQINTHKMIYVKKASLYIKMVKEQYNKIPIRGHI